MSSYLVAEFVRGLYFCIKLDWKTLRSVQTKRSNWVMITSLTFPRYVLTSKKTNHSDTAFDVSNMVWSLSLISCMWWIVFLSITWIMASVLFLLLLVLWSRCDCNSDSCSMCVLSHSWNTTSVNECRSQIWTSGSVNRKISPAIKSILWDLHDEPSVNWIQNWANRLSLYSLLIRGSLDPSGQGFLLQVEPTKIRSRRQLFKRLYS